LRLLATDYEMRGVPCDVVYLADANSGVDGPGRTGVVTRWDNPSALRPGVEEQRNNETVKTQDLAENQDQDHADENP
jgi:hypothetical protein